MIFFHLGDESSFRAKKWPGGKTKRKQPRMGISIVNGKVKRFEIKPRRGAEP